MRFVNKLLVGTLACTLFGTVGLRAQDEEEPAVEEEVSEESNVSVSIDTGFVNQYIWRGFELNGSASMQPGVTVGYKGLSLSTWSNFATEGPNDRAWTEHDFVVDYSGSFAGDSGFGYSVGYINYAFPDIAQGEGKFTHEVYVGINHDDVLAPSFTVNFDVDDGSGAYYFFGISPSVAIGKGVTFDPSFGFASIKISFGRGQASAMSMSASP